MKRTELNYFGQTRIWWLVLIVGIMLIIGGFAYWMFPILGYAVSSLIFGWLLISAGVVQVCVAAGPNHGDGWGWWIAGGVIDMFVGFMMVRSVMLSEIVLPFFLAIIFIYWGIEAFIGSAAKSRVRYRWLGIVNGILLCIIGFMFLEAGWVSDMLMASFLTSLAFIYWGFTVALAAYEMKPYRKDM